MPRFSSIEEFREWWDNESHWTERVAFVKETFSMVVVNGEQKRPEAVADVKFKELSDKLVRDLIE